MAEQHRSGRVGWLRAAALGADDGIVSISSLMIGVAASSASTEAILLAGVAGLVAGSMSMAVGEYVSVSAQRDAEQADVNLETRELADRPQDELKELAQIYMKRGLDETLAMKVAEQLSGRDRTDLRRRQGLTKLARRCVVGSLVGAPTERSRNQIPPRTIFQTQSLHRSRKVATTPSWD